MKHDRSHRRDVRRHADPSVICLPGPKLPYTPPRHEPEATGAPSSPLPIPDDDMLDAELLAHKNIFEVQPRMSRQARRKALRAEKKAARRVVTERFLTGAPSLGEAASQFSVAAMPVALLENPVGDVIEIEALDEGPLMVAERPEPTVMEAPEVEIALAEKQQNEASEEIELLEPSWAEDAEEPVALEQIAQLISATGPLIVDDIDAEEAPLPEGVPSLRSETEAPARAAATHATPEDMESEPPEWLAQKSAAMSVPIEAMTTPLPRNRALVPARRSWLMRVMPWLAPRRKPLSPAPALAELHDLRFELVGALQRLDQIIDRLPETARQ